MMASSIEEGEGLAQRLVQGDQEALGLLFSRHRQRLWRMINFRMDHRMLGRVDRTTCCKRPSSPPRPGWDTTATNPAHRLTCVLRMITLQTLTRRASASPRRADARCRSRGGCSQVARSADHVGVAGRAVDGPADFAPARRRPGPRCSIGRNRQSPAWTRWIGKCSPCAISRS